MCHNNNTYLALILHFIEIFNVWKLFPLHVSVMGSHYKEAVNVERHPDPITNGCHDDLQINVVTKYQPKPERGLKHDRDPHQTHPG